MIKSDELKNPLSCLNKSADDEPLFVLRAKDPIAPIAIRHWVTMSNCYHQKNKAKEALELAEKMEAWRKQNCPSVGIPRDKK